MSTERQVYDGLRLIGIIRERDNGGFVAVIDEQIIGPFDTPRQATDALLELPRPEVST